MRTDPHCRDDWRLGLFFILSCFVATAAAQTTQTGPAQEFYHLHEQWTQLTDQMTQLQTQYAQAPEEDRQAILEQAEDAQNQRARLWPQIATASVAAYEAAPNEDEKITQFVISVCGSMIATDAYEQAAEIANILIKYNCPNLRVYDMAGIAAYAMSDFEVAKRYFQVAEDAHVLSRLGRRYAAFTDSYRNMWLLETKVREAEAAADDLPRVKIKTTQGDMVLELFENQAPNTVANFINLVEAGFYDGLTFHRVLKNFMAQGGCPKGDGSGGPGWSIACECYKQGFRRHFRGSISMAHAGRDTGGSQFFLTFQPTQHLDGKHTVFGRIIEGIEVLQRLQRRNPTDTHIEPDKIVEATVIRKRNHSYEVTKLPSSR